LSEPLKNGEVECRKCHDRYVPSFTKDYYGGKDGQGGLCESCMMTEALEQKPAPVDTPQDPREGNCKLTQGSATCRYLVNQMGRWQCTKGSSLQEEIDQRSASMGAKGNNCSGPPDFKTLV
jgi:hypothetical protein